jgi:RND family efflux transporter MFP subunit
MKRAVPLTLPPARRISGALVLALVAVLATGCNGPDRQAALAPLGSLDTLVVGSGVDDVGSRWDGVVEAVRQASLSAQTSGRVTAVLADVNDPVQAGQVLVRLTAVEQQAGAATARAQLQAATAAADEARLTYQRYQSLVGQQYVSKSQLDQAKAALDSAVAQQNAARAQLAQAAQQTDYTVVRAPYAGLVAAREVEPGEAVAPGTPLMVVYAPGELRVEVQVPQSVADAIRARPQATIETDGRSIPARQVIVYPSADPASHSVTVRAILPDGTSARPGMTAKVTFPIASSVQVVSVPDSTLVRRGELTGVYVLADGSVTLRQVRVGDQVGTRIEVLSGLKPGERIATDPLAALEALTRQRAASAGATHE